jgi:hypothetical protein
MARADWMITAMAVMLVEKFQTGSYYPLQPTFRWIHRYLELSGQRRLTLL